MDIHILLVQGSNVSLLYPKTERASLWINTHISGDYQVFAKGIVVDSHLIEPILQGIKESDLAYLIQNN